MNEITAQNIEKKGMSTGAKWGMGCGIGCLVIIMVIAIAGFVGFKMVKQKIDDTATELQELGFDNVVSGQTLEIKDDITKPTLYKAQMVKILADCNTNLAVMAQICEIHGKVDGKVYFRGQMLIIQPQAELRNGLDVLAQAIVKYGTVRGEITGKYQAIQDQSKDE